MRWLAPVALAVVFAWAGGAKYADLPGTAAGFAALGVRSAESRAIQVPSLELVTAALLIAVPRVGAGLALVLLAAFSWLLVRLLRAGVTEPCRCFGSGRTRSVRRQDLTRNAALAALAVVTLVAPPS